MKRSKADDPRNEWKGAPADRLRDEDLKQVQGAAKDQPIQDIEIVRTEERWLIGG